MANFNFDAEARSQILAEIKRRFPAIGCYVCQKEKWDLAEGFIALPLLENFYMGQRGKGNLVCVAYVCETCGNTLLINLGQIGLAHLVAPSREDQRKAWNLPPE